MLNLIRSGFIISALIQDLSDEGGHGLSTEE